jgi:hypothetical protein
MPLDVRELCVRDVASEQPDGAIATSDASETCEEATR